MTWQQRSKPAVDQRRCLRSARLGSACALILMALGVLAVYCPPVLLSGNYTLIGGDYFDLHQHRIRFAQDALFGPRPHLPAWYPRELLGTPFWSNVQNFPFIPTRFALLLMDRFIGFVVAVNLAALLAALFTYLYCRRVGLARLPSAAGGWTFACAGFFASRVMVGHLPLLEAYCALPLLLWLTERSIQLPGGGRPFALNLLAIALAAASLALAGHPQIPIYAFAFTMLYILYRARDMKGLKSASAIALGIAAAAFALWPMFLLVRRSTRLLALDTPANNILFPFYRLATFLFPWKDGWPESVWRTPPNPFIGPTDAYFWDTVCYVGWLPLLACLFLAIGTIYRRRMPASPWPVFAIIGPLALLTALPPIQRFLCLIPGTILRSPSRQVYLTTFALALALAVAIDMLIKSNLLRNRKRAWALAALCFLAHLFDLYQHDRFFIFPVSILSPASSFSVDALRAAIGDGRIAVDIRETDPVNREFDDVGFFDSIMLSRPYRALIDLSGAPPRLNTQILSGPALHARALAYAGAKLVITRRPRADLVDMRALGPLHVYAVPDPAPRAAFIPLSQATFLDEDQMHQRLRDPAADIRRGIMLPSSCHVPLSRPATFPALVASVAYERTTSDDIALTVSTNQPGFLRVIESWDPGWRATIDGRPAHLLPADAFVIGVPIPLGTHQVSLHFATPGATAGALISLASLPILAALSFFSRKPRMTP